MAEDRRAWNPTARSGSRTVWLLALAPWAAFLVALQVSATAVDFRSASPAGLVVAAPLYLVFVALPSALPLAAARTPALRVGVTAVMTTVAVVTGILAGSTDDAQAGLAVLYVPMVALPLALVLWVAQSVAARRATSPGAAADADAQGARPASTPDRLAALTIDLLLVGGVLLLPMMALSGSHREVEAVVVALAVACGYIAVSAFQGATIGQSLLGLVVVDVDDRRRIGIRRAVHRSLLIAIELVVTLAFPPIAVAELIAMTTTGRSVADRITGTSVVRRNGPRR